MSAGRICTREVDLASFEEPVQAAAQRMHARKVGTLMVLDPDRRPIGILTDRDLAVRVVAEGLDPNTTSVGEIMSPSPRSVWEDTPIEEALATMRRGPFRRVAVVDNDDRLVGLLSLDDVLGLLGEELNEVRRLISQETPSSLAAG
ncbi:MAG: CBS domain-containing protein [Planctomyces sp.]|nr:CBS domain-containing protein [Planctomyces sp.]